MTYISSAADPIHVWDLGEYLIWFEAVYLQLVIQCTIHSRNQMKTSASGQCRQVKFKNSLSPLHIRVPSQPCVENYHRIKCIIICCDRPFWKLAKPYESVVLSGSTNWFHCMTEKWISEHNIYEWLNAVKTLISFIFLNVWWDVSRSWWTAL